jgi:Co/Zn/Cd efflux system component
VGLNTAIVVVAAVAGLHANSLSLLMDSIHNLSDEMALVLPRTGPLDMRS